MHPLSNLRSMIHRQSSIYAKDPKIALLQTCRELEVTTIAYSALGRGLLSGLIHPQRSPDDLPEKDFRRSVERDDATNFSNILKITDRLTALGEKYGMTSSQVALAWLLAQGEDNIPIPGTTKIKYLSDNLASFNVKLSAEDVAAVHALALQADAGHRHRYPPAFAKLLFADTPEL
ncbi:NADP-dependent oxidoreductase domain-containing protein [Mycena albidolilacea]|uniref:NADP-dependent oxidoreductase domain-containing protein n=1 Tax=Mycena albidolilacea TaxID=1033008 RepID=A0AAD7F592_9AGAR|nr:NADP-dependent oxidoreductase domain-containing protein [Mycena albidolilacea]